MLRNNITTAEHPLGVYHPHGELHHIKKENIGLIEVMGLAVLPARLKDEMNRLAEAILSGSPIREDEVLEKHADWVEGFAPKYPEIFGADTQEEPIKALGGAAKPEAVTEMLRTEIGLVFATVLEHAGVFKRDEAGQQAMERFIKSL